VSASSSYGGNYKPYFAFNSTYLRGDGQGGEWATNGVYKNFSLTIECPDVVRVWKVALRGRDSNTQTIFRWRLEGSNDGRDFTTLFRAPNPTYLGNTIQQFKIGTNSKYILLCMPYGILGHIPH